MRSVIRDMVPLKDRARWLGLNTCPLRYGPLKDRARWLGLNTCPLRYGPLKDRARWFEGEFTSSRRCVSSWSEEKTDYIFLVSVDAITKSHVHVSSDWSDRLSAGYRITYLVTYLLVHPVTPAIPSGSSSLELGIRWVLTWLLCDCPSVLLQCYVVGIT